MTSFSCSLPGSAGSPDALCLVGGECVNATGPQSCACPSGFSADDSLFYQPNCALPAGAYTGLLAVATAAEVVVGGALAWELWTRRSRSGTLLFRVSATGFTAVAMYWGAALATSLEGRLGYVGVV